MKFNKKDKTRTHDLEERLRAVDHKRIEVLANFGCYAPRIIIRRIFIVSIISVFLFFIAALLTHAELPDGLKSWLPMLLFLIFAFNSVSEVNIFVARLFRQLNMIKHRIVPLSAILLIITTLIIVLWVKLAQQVYHGYDILKQPLAQLTLVFGVIFLFVMHLLIIMSDITREWMESRKEIERLRNAKLESDYHSLQDRLNPHFLFNNLSVLRSLIRYDAAAAEKFTENFTDVYRYVLRSHENRTVSLSSEVNFLNSYIALHKERLGEGISVKIDICDQCLDMELPPMSVQLLVENAIKHNIASRHNPLVIDISTRDTELIVKNKINKKETTYSTQTGLKTLNSQIQMVTNREMTIIDDGKVYEVRLPLL